LAGKHDAKPSHEELKDWLHSGQLDVLIEWASSKCQDNYLSYFFTFLISKEQRASTLKLIPQSITAKIAYILNEYSSMIPNLLFHFCHIWLLMKTSIADKGSKV
jgi:hypothetical protein